MQPLVVGPVENIMVECLCGCGALTNAGFPPGALWCAAVSDRFGGGFGPNEGESAVFLGAPKGAFSWMLRAMMFWKGVPQGKVRMVTLKGGRRLMITDPIAPRRMAAPPPGCRSEPQDMMDSWAGMKSAFGPVPKIQLAMVVPSRWTIPMDAAQ